MLQRSHSQIFIGFLIIYVLLTSIAGIAAWQLIDAKLRDQAIESAQSVSRIITQGGFTLNQDVLKRMQELTGYQFHIADAVQEPNEDLVTVLLDDGRLISIDYRNQQYQAHQSLVFWVTTAFVIGGVVLFIPIAWFLARRFASPLEVIAKQAQQIGEGNWQESLAVSGSSEIEELSAAFEQMRQQLLKLDEENRQAERLSTLGTFTATIAHEVRNPLAAIKMMMQLLEKDYPDQRFVHIKNEIERLDLMVDELLGYSAGMKINKQACDLEEVVCDVQRLLERQAKHADVDLTYKVIEKEPVQADAQRLRQLLLNIVLNAIQIQHGGGAVVIAIHRDGFVVIDDGPGVAPELVKDLFKAFSSNRERGTGLGLHLAQQIAEAHGATLSYARENNQTCFKLSALS